MEMKRYNMGLMRFCLNTHQFLKLEMGHSAMVMGVIDRVKKKSLKLRPEVLFKSENRTTLVLRALGFCAHERGQKGRQKGH